MFPCVMYCHIHVSMFASVNKNGYQAETNLFWSMPIFLIHKREIESNNHTKTIWVTNFSFSVYILVSFLPWLKTRSQYYILSLPLTTLVHINCILAFPSGTSTFQLIVEFFNKHAAHSYHLIPNSSKLLTPHKPKVEVLTFLARF